MIKVKPMLQDRNHKDANEPLARFKELRKMIRVLGKICGADVLNENYKPNFATYFTVALISFSVVSCIYSIAFFSGSIPEQLQTLCCCGIVLPGCKKLQMAIKKSRDFYKLVGYTEIIYETNTSPNRQCVLKECIKSTRNSFYLLFGVIVLGLCLFSAVPFYAIFVKGEKVLMLNLIVPYVDHRQLFGYLINTFVHGFYTLFGVSGNVTYDLLSTIMICNYNTMIKLIEESLKRFDNMVTETDTSSLQRRVCFRNIIMMCNETDWYIIQMEECISPTLFIQVGFAAFSTMVCLFAATVNNWTSGYGFALFLLSQIMVLSYMGTLLQNGNDDFCNILYNTNWYLYSKEEKYILLNLLLRRQNATELWIGPISPLNVESGAAIVQTIYKTYMMMTSFIE